MLLDYVFKEYVHSSVAPKSYRVNTDRHAKHGVSLLNQRGRHVSSPLHQFTKYVSSRSCNSQDLLISTHFAQVMTTLGFSLELLAHMPSWINDSHLLPTPKLILPWLLPLCSGRLGGLPFKHGVGHFFDAGDWLTVCNQLHYLAEGSGIWRRWVGIVVCGGWLIRYTSVLRIVGCSRRERCAIGKNGNSMLRAPGLVSIEIYGDIVLPAWVVCQYHVRLGRIDRSYLEK